ncbi:MAG: YqaJ viral recombinase family protein [Candidatus Thiodiazotropha lotti]|nr:YqaJ viral recombinase family protein [Candidatus Thiodiazotropha lotti]
MTRRRPWRIWAEKLGKVAPEDLSGNPNVQRGIALEPLAREAIEQKHDLLLLPVCGEHDEHSILRASFDGIDDNGRPVEIKCPGDKVWSSINKGGDQSLEYRRYIAQVQHQILVSGSDSALLVYFHNGEMLEFTLRRDEKMCREIIDKAQAFWELVVNQKEPEKDPLLDVFVPTGEKRGEWMTLANDRKRITRFLSEAETRVKTLKGQQKDVDTAMIGLMGEFLHAEADGVAITRYSQQGAVDYKALIADLYPDLELTDELLAKYRKSSSNRTRVTLSDTDLSEKKASDRRHNTEKRVNQIESSETAMQHNCRYAW